MRAALLRVIVVVTLLRSSFLIGQTIIDGRLKPGLTPYVSTLSVAVLHDADAPTLVKFTPQLNHVKRVQITTLDLSRQTHVPAALVTEYDGSMCVYTDGLSAGTFRQSERVCLEPLHTSGNYDRGGQLRIPFKSSVYSALPVVFRTLRPSNNSVSSDGPLLYSAEFLSEGQATVGGRNVLIAYSVDVDKASVNPLRSNTYVDEDGDGNLDPMRERKYGDRTTAPLFRVGNTTFKASSVDLSGNRFTLVTLPADQYRQFDWAAGATLPDFVFTDLDGNKKTLSSVKGRLVLLDFWATWCHACLADLPLKKATYERWHSKGFEIVGIDGDSDSQEKAKMLVAKMGLPWPEARYDADLIQQRFRISVWPTAILIDENRKVISSKIEDLSGEALDKRIAQELSR